MRHIVRTLWIALSVSMVLPVWAAAQLSTGQISGRVTDASGAVLPGVTATATQTETQFVRTTITNDVGVYTLPNLPVGPYRVEATLQGFQTFVQSGMTIQVNSNLVVDPAMRVGDIAETLTVTARPSDIAVETRRLGVRSEERRVGGGGK